ncbi:MAG: hypothetical protein JWR03_1480 [Cohnella sp.]|nr:hypothetical protein [Cohnella sp.]
MITIGFLAAQNNRIEQSARMRSIVQNPYLSFVYTNRGPECSPFYGSRRYPRHNLLVEENEQHERREGDEQNVRIE